MDIIARETEHFDQHQSYMLAQAVGLSPFYQPGNLAYYQAYFAQAFVDASFCVHYNKQPLLLVLVCAPLEGVCSYYGLPIQLIWRQDAPTQERKGAFNAALAVLQSLWGTDLQRVHYKNGAAPLSEMALYLLKQGFPAAHVYRQMVDLTRAEESILTEVRKTYRADIRWGEKNMSFKLLDAATIQAGDIEPFRHLHIEVAGRETRSKQSWERQEQLVQLGEGFMIYGFLEGELVATGLFVHNQEICYYGVGAYRRELFDKPVSHALVWRGLMHAKALGCQRFEFGDAYFPVRQEAGLDADQSLTPNAKEVAISRFKQGFGGDIFVELLF